MTDKKNKAIESNQKEESSKHSVDAKQLPKKPFKWTGLLLVLALILALGGLAGSAYIWLQFDQYKQQSAAQLKQALSSVDTQLKNKLNSSDVSQQVKSVVAPLQLKIATLEKTNQSSAQARKSLTESTKKLFELYGRDKNGWQLAEVEYLLRIAQHRLVIENDFQGAEKTLKAADEKISEIADPGLLPVRVAISDERVLLQARSRPDLVGIVLSLSRITKQIPLLNLTANPQHKNSANKTSAFEMNQVDSNAPWQDQIMQFVKGLVTVEPVKKSISTPSVNLISAINTLEEKLKLAKWAVLERDQNQYQQLIKQSNELFKRYFDPNNNYHAEINDELERLSTLEIRPELPDISGSLLLLKSIMIKREHQKSFNVEQIPVAKNEAEAAKKRKPKKEILTEEIPAVPVAIQNDVKGENNE